MRTSPTDHGDTNTSDTYPKWPQQPLFRVVDTFKECDALGPDSDVQGVTAHPKVFEVILSGGKACTSFASQIIRMCDPLVVGRGEENFDPPNLQLGREMAPIVVSAMREWRDTCGVYYPPYQHSGGTRGFSFRTLDSSRTSSSASAL